MEKKKLVERILEHLHSEMETLTRAVDAAREAATHEESKAEDQHDTRGLEASYLAGAQASRVGELKQMISRFKFLTLREFRAGDPISEGALVEVEWKGRKSHYFLVSQGGGISVQWEGKTIQVITPRAPLGEALQGRRAGEAVEVESQGSSREYEIISVC